MVENARSSSVCDCIIFGSRKFRLAKRDRIIVVGRKWFDDDSTMGYKVPSAWVVNVEEPAVRSRN